MSIQIGQIKTRNKVFLAPMSGVSDLPFRRMAAQHGAGLVVSEMIASKELVRTRKDMVARARRDDITPFVIQLAGREAEWMGEGARIAEQLGCDAIDINMGCPARKVTGSLSGSALMRDLDHALSLIEATVVATALPVTLKMRLGWDHNTINAPKLAQRAENAGVQMITVHGRTRCQFYTGKADWRAIAAVKKSVSIPVVANGDAKSAQDMADMLDQSGADAIMVGRASYGQPWLAGELADILEPGTGVTRKSLGDKCALWLQHYNDVISFYGLNIGIRMARKHLGWMLDVLRNEGHLDDAQSRAWRLRLMKHDSTQKVNHDLKELFDQLCGQKVYAA